MTKVVNVRNEMFQDLVDQQEKWVGGRLVSYHSFPDRPLATKISGFKLTDSWFEVQGKDFNCGGPILVDKPRETLTIVQSPSDGALALGVHERAGHRVYHGFHIIPKDSSALEGWWEKSLNWEAKNIESIP